jgi:ABC-type transport system involved in multi-copper enzyme maturation permease subunit
MGEGDGARTGWIRRSAGRVLGFFFFLGRRAKKTRVFVLIGLLPVIQAVVIKTTELSRGAPAGEGLAIFSNFLMIFYLQFFLVILTLFYGTSVASEETEGRTLPFLQTRPLSKPGIVLGKYAAYSLLTSLIVLASLLIAFLILAGERLGSAAAWGIFVRSAGVLLLGILSYTAFFTFLGVLLKRSLFVGLIFGFGWESVISFFPGSTQRFSIVHYLKSLLPSGPRGRFSFLMFRLEPTRPALALLALALITAVFLGLAGLLFRAKEYLAED